MCCDYSSIYTVPYSYFIREKAEKVHKTFFEVTQGSKTVSCRRGLKVILRQWVATRNRPKRHHLKVSYEIFMTSVLGIGADAWSALPNTEIERHCILNARCALPLLGCAKPRQDEMSLQWDTKDQANMIQDSPPLAAAYRWDGDILKRNRMLTHGTGWVQNTEKTPNLDLYEKILMIGVLTDTNHIFFFLL